MGNFRPREIPEALVQGEVRNMTLRAPDLNELAFAGCSEATEDASYLPLPRVRRFSRFEIGIEWVQQASVDCKTETSTAALVASVLLFSTTHHYPCFF